MSAVCCSGNAPISNSRAWRIYVVVEFVEGHLAQ